jgi:PKD domain-containing protein
LKKILLLSILILFLFIQNTITACTGFTYSQEDTVLVGSNEDWYDYDFWIRTLPATEEKHGRIIIENHWPLSIDPDWHCPQCGLNDQGLFFDCFATPRLIPTNSQHKPYYYDNSDHYKYSLESYALSVCSTIEEVIQVYDTYNLEHMSTYQVLWVDNTGDSIIIEGDDIIYKQGDYQVVTNFYQSHPQLGGYPCWRYETAVEMLEDLPDLTIPYFAEICNATHQTGFYPSVYSTIADLKEQTLTLYYFYNYNNQVTINLEQELQQGEHTYFLKDLFETIHNQAPLKPSIPTGPTQGRTRRTYTYTTQTTDPDNDTILYQFDWGDGTISDWLQARDNHGEASYQWLSEGDYQIRVRAKDVFNHESPWSDPLQVIIPKHKTINKPIITLLQKIIEILPILQSLY